jgi:hypothetical protein
MQNPNKRPTLDRSRLLGFEQLRRDAQPTNQRLLLSKVGQTKTGVKPPPSPPAPPPIV